MNETDTSKVDNFRADLETVINRYSMENGSNTCDFILAEYLTDCLAAYDKATNRRERWYSREPSLIGSTPAPANGDTAIAITPTTK